METEKEKNEDSYGHSPKSLMGEYDKSLGKKKLYADLHPALHKKLYK